MRDVTHGCARSPFVPLVLAAVALLGSSRAGADPMACDAAQPGFLCSVQVGSSAMQVFADGTDGGALALEQFLANGAFRIGEAELFVLVDRTVEAAPALTLQATPTADQDTGTIETSFIEAGTTPRFTQSVSFTLSETAAGAQVDESLLLEAISAVSLRLYVFTDYDLRQGFDDDDAFFEAPGRIVQIRGGTIGSVEVTSGPDPDAWQIDFTPDLISALADIRADGGLLDLTNATSGIGPGPIEHAFSWDIDLAAGEVFQLGLAKQVVPEPSSGALLALGLAALHATRRRARSPSYKARPSPCRRPADREPDGRVRAVRIESPFGRHLPGFSPLPP